MIERNGGFVSDLIERKKAIDEIEERKYANGYRNVAVISELNRLEGYIMRLPSAQPETHEKRTETHACDLISRKMVLALPRNKVRSLRTYEVVEETINVTDIEHLPSAQPEIIRCNACRHWTQTTGKMHGFGLGNCDYHNAKLVNCNGFCYWAERRTDG